MANIHVGDVGTQFLATVTDENGNVINIASATALNFRFQRPDGSWFTVSGSLVTNGSDGLFQYLTVAGDLNLPGSWFVQGVVTFSNGLWHGDEQKFRVYDNIGGVA